MMGLNLVRVSEFKQVEHGDVDDDPLIDKNIMQQPSEKADEIEVENALVMLATIAT